MDGTSFESVNRAEVRASARVLDGSKACFCPRDTTHFSLDDFPEVRSLSLNILDFGDMRRYIQFSLLHIHLLPIFFSMLLLYIYTYLLILFIYLL